MVTLYDHQADMIERVRQSLGSGARRVLLQAATGSGKSIMASSMIAGARAKDKQSLFVVPRVDLMAQMSNTFRQFDIPHSYIAQGLRFNEFARTHIASLQTLVKRLDHVNPDVVFVDECHYGYEMIQQVINAYPQAKIVGLSATPARTDNMGMGDLFEHMVQGPSIRWLIDNKFLSEYAIVHPSIEMARGQIGGDPVEEWLRHADGRLTICYCRDKVHGRATVQRFLDAGVPAAFMESNTPDAERKRIIAEFAAGKIKIIVNVALLVMGFDLASQIGRKVNVRCVLDLQPTGSLPNQLQKNGRMMRYDPDGHAVMIDLAGNTYESTHGLPCDDREWILDTSDVHKHDREFRERIPKLITCKSCFRPVKIGPTHCPYCGTAYVTDGKKVRIVDGKLIVMTPEMLRREKAQQEKEAEAAKKTARVEVGRAKTIADLQRIATERGYAKGWIWRQAQLKGIKA